MPADGTDAPPGSCNVRFAPLTCASSCGTAVRRSVMDWKTQTRVTTLEPLKSLLAAVSDTDANLLVVGARGATGVERLLLGSVAEGSLDRSPVPVLIVR